MSSHTQNSSTQTSVDGGQANFETAVRIATVIVEANQRLFKLQSEAANAAFAENSKHLMSSLSTMDSGALLGEWARLYEANTRRVLDVTRSCFEIMPQTQAEIANLMGALSPPPTKKRSNTSTSSRRQSATVATRPPLR